jgi:NAD(P)-dependent dehydrogenase (short-subunit alcohol dehydrogenase family)
MTVSTPITTPFGATSTAAEVLDGVDLTGRRIIVTGGASGIGVETARALAGAGAEVTLAVRDLAAGERAAEDIIASTGNKQVLVGRLDLADQGSVAEFAAAWDGPLHVLVDNAGIMASPLMRTPQGWEMQFATNHLGHFALANRLHPALAAGGAAGGARIVSVSSSAHLRSPVVFEDIHFEHRPYDPWTAYGQAKTANVLFAVEVAERWAGRRHHRQRAASRRDPDPAAALRHRGGPGPAARPVHRPDRGLEDTGAGRRDLGAAGRLAAARRGGRPVLRGLQRGRAEPAGQPPRGGRLRAGPGGRGPALAGLGGHAGRLTRANPAELTQLS